jgi:hypothetical protein
MKDPIVSEIHDIRAQLLRDHQGDPVLYVRSAMKRQQERKAHFITAKMSHEANSNVHEPTPHYSAKFPSAPLGKNP